MICRRNRSRVATVTVAPARVAPGLAAARRLAVLGVVLLSWIGGSAGCAARTATTPAAAPAAALPRVSASDIIAAVSRADRSGAVFAAADHGAVPDDGIDDAPAIQSAIDAAGGHGGGRVVLPEGVLDSGPITLRSGVVLVVPARSTLRFLPDPDRYPPREVRWEGSDIVGFTPLISAEDAADVGIVGAGTIDGSGAWWWERFSEHRALRDQPGVLSAWQRRFAGLNADRPQRGRGWMFPRPVLVYLAGCERVRLEGVALRDAPFWTVHLFDCEDVLIRGVRVDAPADSPNTDAIDLESCRRVLVEGCDLNTGDDLVAVKSGYRTDGRRVDPPSADIIVRRTRFGAGRAGLAIGSETASPIRRVLVEDCTFEGTLRGVRIKTQRTRGGVIEGVTVRRSVFRAIPRAALQIDMFYLPTKPEPVNARTPRIRGVLFQDIEIDGAGRSVEVRALPEMPVDGLVLERVHGTGAEGAVLHGVRGLAARDVSVVVTRDN